MVRSNGPRNVALRIAAVYMLAGALWILVSDKVVSLFVNDKDTITFISLIKGWVYVAATGMLIFTLVLNALLRAKKAENELKQKNKELSSAKDELAATCEQLAESETIAYSMAYHDQLTGLKNRSSLIDRMKDVLQFSFCKKFAFLFIDIDNFKYVNDTMGHSFGDLILIAISSRLKTFLEGDNNIYRLGGDEFIIILEDYTDLSGVENASVNILNELKKRVEIDDSIIFNTVSIGVSLFPEHGSTMDELLKKADIAVYKAKDSGKNKIVIYDEHMNEVVNERMNVERCLRTALENNEFELYYQPQLDLRSYRISGFEALIRWHSAELGFVSPAKFIRIAEDTHLIIPIGEWVMKNACVFLNKMHQRGFTDLSVSVNISMLQLLQDDFTDLVFSTLEMTCLDPQYLEIEITESILMESYEAISEKLELLRAHGVKVALDDFGKGYSSLNYLRNMPISSLKIDKSFIDTIAGSEKNKSLTDLIVRIGKSMDLCVIAEGVETQEQLEYLKKHKCTKIQGYLFSKPLPESDAIKRMDNENIMEYI